MRLHVVIFAYNEEPTIQSVIENVPTDIDGVSDVHIAVIDDGSTDRTAELARQAGGNVIRHGRNRGLGAAFHSGLTDALAHQADIMVTVDGDGQFDTAKIPVLIRPILDGRADMTTCSRFIDPTLTPEMPTFKRWGNAWVASLVSRLTGRRFYDVSCGFRAYNRECLVRLNLMGRFTYTHEAIMEMVFKRQQVIEVPLAVKGVRAHGRSRVASNLLKYGWQTSWIMLGALLNHRPHWVFGGLSILCFLLGIVCSVGGSITWFMHDVFIKSLMLIGGFFLGLSVLLLLFALEARVVHRNQFLIENVLYELRVQARPDRNDSADHGDPNGTSERNNA